MADIRIEYRTRRVWPWIVAGAAVVIALVIWGVARVDGETDPISEGVGTTQDAAFRDTLDSLRQADRLRDKPWSFDHSAQTREAFPAAATVMSPGGAIS